MFSALGITATTIFQNVTTIETFGFGIQFITQLVPYLLVIAAFVFVYIFIPNIRVQSRAALTGGIVASILWETTGWIFASFVVETAQFTAVYSNFAILTLFMTRVYLSWLMLLVGASVAFYYQNPQYLSIQDRVLRLSNRLQERVALPSVYLNVRHFCQNLPGWTPKPLGNFFNVPTEPLGRIFRALEKVNVLVETRSDSPTYLLARELDVVRVRDILEIVRTAEENTQVHSDVSTQSRLSTTS